MDSLEMGTYINQLRKKQGLTQKQLAETLNVSDKSVSKWERGRCYPDIALIPKLATALGVTPGELLSAKSQESGSNKNPDSNTENTIHYFSISWQDRIKHLKSLTSLIFLGCLLVSITACSIPDICMNGTLTWTRYVISSELFGSFVILPILLKDIKGIPVSLAFSSLLILPFLKYLSYLTNETLVFTIGWKVSVASIAFLWIIFIIAKCLKNIIFTAYGIVTLLCIPFSILINWILMLDLEEQLFDIWDFFDFAIFIVIAVVLFVIQTLYKKKHK